MNTESENKIKEQIRDNFRKAFYDAIDSTVNSKEPDYDWIINLYTEIRDRLTRYLKKDKDTYKQIMEEFDVDFFSQMIKNDVFDFNSMIKLVKNTFFWIEKLQAPVRDEYTREAKNRVLDVKSAKIVAEYIKEVNTCLDFIDEDMIKFYCEIEKEEKASKEEK